MTFVINIGVLRALQSAGLGAVPAYAIAVAVSVQFNFLTNNALVWGDRRIVSGRIRAWLQRWVSFHGCVGVAVLLNMAVFVLVSMWLPDIAAAVVATSTATVLKFFSLDRLAFRAEVPTPSESESA